MSESELPCIISEARTCKAISQDNLVFIIGSGSSEFSEEVQTVKEVLKLFGLEGYFALLSEEEKGLDIFCDKICSKIQGSLFCIVMLNDPKALEYIEEATKEKKTFRAPRANVYYELGLAVALKKKITPLIRKDMKLPFDIQHIDVITYGNLAELQEKLTSSVRAILRKGFTVAAVKAPKLHLLLVDQEGKASDTIYAEPVITKVKYVDEKYATPEEHTAIALRNLTASLNVAGFPIAKGPDKSLVALGLEIWNKGEIPAQNILITLKFPEDCELIEESNASELDFAAHTGRKTRGGLYVNDKRKNLAQAWLDRLGNDRAASDFERVLVRFNTEAEKTFEAQGTVIQDNFPRTDFTFKIFVKPKIIKETRFKQA